MEQFLREMYLDDLIDDVGLQKAVDEKGWITQAQADAIRALKSET